MNFPSLSASSVLLSHPSSRGQWSPCPGTGATLSWLLCFPVPHFSFGVGGGRTGNASLLVTLQAVIWGLHCRGSRQFKAPQAPGHREQTPRQQPVLWHWLGCSSTACQQTWVTAPSSACSGNLEAEEKPPGHPTATPPVRGPRSVCPLPSSTDPSPLPAELAAGCSAVPGRGSGGGEGLPLSWSGEPSAVTSTLTLPP